MSPQTARQPEPFALPEFRAPYAPPDEALAEALLREAPRATDAEARTARPVSYAQRRERPAFR